MVHFGRYLNGESRRLVALCSSGSLDSYVNYKALKKLVKVCASSSAQAATEVTAAPIWHSDLESNVDSDLGVVLPSTVEGATSGKERFLLQIQGEVQKLNDFVLQAKSEAQTQDDLQELAIFAETNRIACHKIVKKFHKKCGTWEELQLFLEHVDEEPFLASLSDEMPEARITLQNRLFLAGVQTHEETSIDVQNSPSVLDAQQAHMELPGSPSAPRSGSVCERVREFLEVLREVVPAHRFRGRLRAAAALLSCGLFLIILSSMSGIVPAMSGDRIASITGGSGLLLALMSVVTCLGTVCPNVPREQQNKSNRYCMWQQLSYAELFVPNFAAAFVAMKVSSDENGQGVAELIEEIAPRQALQLVGEPKVASDPKLSTTCGCCLGDFGDDDGVTLLPCYHIFCDDCILSWALSSANGSHSCPMCRSSFRIDGLIDRHSAPEPRLFEMQTPG